jgi:hypothetical protein
MASHLPVSYFRERYRLPNRKRWKDLAIKTKASPPLMALTLNIACFRRDFLINGRIIKEGKRDDLHLQGVIGLKEGKVLVGT